MEKIFEIKIEPTSNASIIKFEANYFLTQHTSYEFENIDHAKNSPLAQQLFYLPFVKRVFIAQNFIAIDKFDIVEWSDVQDEVAEQIKTYLNSGQPVISETSSTKKVPITIYAESTPNPAVLKFVANKKLVTSGHEFKSIDDTKEAPIAEKLFHFPFVKEVYIDENYISINKYDMADWNDITLEIREFLREYLEEGKEVLSENATASKSQVEKQAEADFEKLDDTSKDIVNIIEEYIKPAVASDGGNIMFDSYDPESKGVKVILQGACSGCPSSTFTLKNGIENMLKEMLKDKVEFVEAING
ncbi:NifU family protein [Aquimarina sp. MMG015]|uniref:NifU family protein n=1 Tax=unclassified Aquimarina TaxID=2627091 RepID=UPI000E471521|nr:MULTISPECIES: NifU family protein [unclassified Aquimarina]AXT57846.1 NifU family protein [Aquimarina sp. AD1]MBQ4803212.1 NifU family protein [Aquimarina sp. MMG015]RKN34994.1 NifU family protein [Aquimarina sp. AD1]